MAASRRERWCPWVELAASIAWFVMDYAWFEQVTWLALALTLPTALGSLAVVALTTPAHASRLVAAAMAAWAVMNSIWMMNDQGVLHAPWLVRACFALGAVLLAAASVRHGRLATLARALVAGFGRLRAPW